MSCGEKGSGERMRRWGRHRMSRRAAGRESQAERVVIEVGGPGLGDEGDGVDGACLVGGRRGGKGSKDQQS